VADTFIETFRTENFHGLTIRFEAHVDDIYEGDFDDDPETAEAIRAGEITPIAVRGVISVDGTDLSFDWLCGLVIKSYSEFLDGSCDEIMRGNLIRGALHKLGKLDEVYRNLPGLSILLPVSRCG
jgi:hypothetical protein